MGHLPPLDISSKALLWIFLLASPALLSACGGKNISSLVDAIRSSTPPKTIASTATISQNTGDGNDSTEIQAESQIVSVGNSGTVIRSESQTIGDENRGTVTQAESQTTSYGNGGAMTQAEPQTVSNDGNDATVTPAGPQPDSDGNSGTVTQAASQTTSYENSGVATQAEPQTVSNDGNDATVTPAGHQPGSDGNSGAVTQAESQNAPANITVSGKILYLSWRPNPEPVDGYVVYNGPSPEEAVSKLMVTPQTTVLYDIEADLGLSSGDRTCFRLRAYNQAGKSDFSDAVCMDIS